MLYFLCNIKYPYGMSQMQELNGKWNIKETLQNLHNIRRFGSCENIAILTFFLYNCVSSLVLIAGGAAKYYGEAYEEIIFNNLFCRCRGNDV